MNKHNTVQAQRRGCCKDGTHRKHKTNPIAKNKKIKK